MAEFDIRDSLAGHLRQVAGWRRNRYRDDLRDPRNLRSAQGLDDLAGYVQALPADDPHLEQLSKYASAGESFLPGQQTLYEIGRFRFFESDTAFDSFLLQLAEFAKLDHGEHGRFGGNQAQGDDPWS